MRPIDLANETFFEGDHNVKSHQHILLTAVILIAITGGLVGCSDGSGSHQAADHHASQVATTSSSHATQSAKKVHTHSHHSSTASASQQHQAILNKLVSYTNKESAGPTGDYYWTTGKAHFSHFAGLAAGDYHFSADAQGRSATARAVLTYSEYHLSQGGRQGDPLEPPAWPENKMVSITYGLTGRTYHGYLYNRSHSIGDSLLGAKSYTSNYNFTTGTRPQNMGADQNGGMRAAEEAAENYWEDNPNTHHVIYYQTTPLYKGSETMPRGSIVDVRSSDKSLNTEVVVINDAEGIRIDYQDGSNNAKQYHRRSSTMAYTHHRSTTSTGSSNSHQSATATTTNGGWTIAGSGMVFVSDSDKYYSEVKNPNNYHYESVFQANASGATQASRGNQYARP